MTDKVTEKKTKPTKKAASPKKDAKLLSQEDRDALLARLDDAGITFESDISDAELLKAISTKLVETKEKYDYASAEPEAKNLRVFENACVNLTDKEFMRKLYYYGITTTYAHLYHDKDADMTRREAWRVANNSGINPVSIQKMHNPYPDWKPEIK